MKYEGKHKGNELSSDIIISMVMWKSTSIANALKLRLLLH